jgi:uncharacterized surface protein with fasciclin (FAS1) repeats
MKYGKLLISAIVIGLASAEEPGTIVDLGIANPDFSTLVAAVTAAGLVETLSGEGPFTLFAPTNEAFAALPAEVTDPLFLPENVDQLVNILKYHVVAGSVPSSSVESGDVETLNGDSIAVDVSEAMGIMLNNDAHVTTADIMASNGVIHVIARCFYRQAVRLRKDPRKEKQEKKLKKLNQLHRHHLLYLSLP